MKRLIIIMMLFAPMAVMAQKFGHVDSQSIMTTLPEIAKINGELQATAQQFENELKAMQEEFQRKMDEYDKAKATMNATTQKETEASLMEMNEKIRQTYAQNQQELQKQQQEKLAPVYQKVQTAIQNVGKAGQYTYIFDQSAALYVGAGSKDVTAEVKAELNKLK